MKNIRGISLIVLVITILVVIILAGAVILSLSQNNPILTANKAKFLSDLNTFQTELELYKTSEYAKSIGNYNPTLLNADTSTATYNNVKIFENATISSIITSMKGDYLNKFEIKNGLLILTFGTEDEKKWAEEQGVTVAGSLPKVIMTVDKDRVAPGTQVNYTLSFVMPEDNNTISIEGNIKLVDVEEQELTGVLNITQSNEVVNVAVNTNSLTDGNYTLKVSEGIITSNTGLKSEAKELSFVVDASIPDSPDISPNTSNPTREVLITIEYYAAIVRQYAITASIYIIPQDSDYVTYTGPFTMQVNGVIWVKSKNAAGTEDETISTLEITNIDRTEPNDAEITAEVDSSQSGQIIIATINVNDNESQIDLNASRYFITNVSTKYDINDSIWDTAEILGENPKNITKEGLPEGEYYIQVLSVDNAENKRVSISNMITLIGYSVPNAPTLATGMTPIKWSGSTVVTTTESDPDWYNYDGKIWANAQTADGSMWVWIPRYSYKIDTPNSNVEQTILIKFLPNTSNLTSSDYTIHPAFKFGDTELTGIWVAKFEAGGTISAVDIKPNVTAIKAKTTNVVFNACRNMERNSRYGWGTTGVGIDTHLMKNVEWGAVAYLTYSIYGKNSEVWKNPRSDNITGRSGTSVNPTGTTTSTYLYNNTNYGVNAGTTGNVYGVFDMSGGVNESVAAYVNNGNSILTTNGLSLVNAESKYKDVYDVTDDTRASNYDNAANKKGDGVWETSNGSSYTWYGDYSVMPSGSSPFFLRGGSFSANNVAGILYMYVYDGSGTITGNDSNGFRPVIAVSDAL